MKAGDEDLPRPWSKYSKGSSLYEERKERTEKRRQEEEEKAEEKKRKKRKMFMEEELLDPKFREFLSVTEPSMKAKAWQNDTEMNPIDPLLSSKPIKSVKESLPAKKEVKTIGGVAAKVESVPVASRKRGGEGIFYTRTKVRFDVPQSTKKEEVKEEAKQVVGEIKKEEPSSDLDWLRSKKRVQKNEENVKEQVQESEESGEEEIEGENEESVKEQGEASEEKEENEMKDENCGEDEEKKSEEVEVESEEEKKREKDERSVTEQLEESGRIFVRNLPFCVQEKDLQKLFSKYGELSEVFVPLDAELKRPRGFAFVTFMIPEKAVAAYASLDNKIWRGRILRLYPSKAKDAPQIESKEKSSYKKRKEEKMKKESVDSANWNTLFIRSDTVAEATAEQLSVRKMELLDPEADDVAVRMALAETSVIADTKKLLEREGVSVERLRWQHSKVQRSEDVILVKNLPFDTSEEEIRVLFGKFGELGRVVLPPSRALALIEFLHSSDAKTAFTKLAYKKFKHVPLFLEWPPTEIFKDKFDPQRMASEKQATCLCKPFFSIIFFFDS